MAVRIEDAGFEIRDQIMWIYGSGFPKSHNIGKSVDKIQGNDREDLGPNPNGRPNCEDEQPTTMGGKYKWNNVTKGTSEWEGWGTALKPAHEPIVMARKPFKGNVAQNVLEWGTGGINIDESRIGYKDDKPKSMSNERTNEDSVWKTDSGFYDRTEDWEPNDTGRWPANIMFECTCENPIPSQQKEVKLGKNRQAFFDKNSQIFGSDKEQTNQRIEDYGDTGVIHTDPNCPCYMLDQQSGISKGNERTSKFTNYGVGEYGKKDGRKTQPTPNEIQGKWFGDKGGASRFFYCPKASKKDRDEGLDGFEEHKIYENTSTDNHSFSHLGVAYKCVRKNNHPTVKPTELMLYLIKLVTPVGGTVMDCFMGSGSTGKAAVRGGFDFIGIEREEEYYNISKARINNG
jgi:site-specific DNA-methyltransferase (adenine-specific)